MSIQTPSVLTKSVEPVCACYLYHDKGPEPWLKKASTDAWLSTGISEAIDSNDGSIHDHGDIYCLVCCENGSLKLFDVPNFNCIFLIDNFSSGKSHLMDTSIEESSKKTMNTRETLDSLRITEIAMHRWSGKHSRPFLFGTLNDGTLLCYHAYLYEVQEDGSPKMEASFSPPDSSGVVSSRLRNLRFVRVFLDTFSREEPEAFVGRQRLNFFKNVGGYEGLFVSGIRPVWFMLCRERLRLHPQVKLMPLNQNFPLNGSLTIFYSLLAL